MKMCMILLTTALIALDVIGAVTVNPTCQNKTGTENQSRPKVSVPQEYMLEGEHAQITCSATVGDGTSDLWWAIYQGLYFTPLNPETYTGKTEKVPIDEENCIFRLTSTLNLPMTEDKDGVLFTCFTYDITKETQVDCPQESNTCAHGSPIKMFRAWPLFSTEGTFVILLVTGWAVVLFPIVIYLLWHTTRNIKPSKLADIGESGHAVINMG